MSGCGDDSSATTPTTGDATLDPATESGPTTDDSDGSSTTGSSLDPDSGSSSDEGSSSTAAGSSSTGASSSSTGEPNIEPEAADDFYFTNTAVDSLAVAPDEGVLGNDMDEDGDMLSVADFDAATDAGGVVEMMPDGSFTYMPPTPFWGDDGFSYTIDDGAGGMATARVRISVAPTVQALGDLDVAGAGFSIEPSTPGDHLGVAVAGGGDFNGDGYGDVIVGADDAFDDERGGAYVVFGGPDVASVSAANIEGDEGGVAILGPSGADSGGYSVAMLGDVNGDGLADVAVGTNDGSGALGGDVYVVFGAENNTLLELEFLGERGFAITGNGEPSFGQSVGAAGDVNGDGLADVIVGVPGTGGSNQGAALVVFGKTDTDPVDGTLPALGGFAIGGIAENGNAALGQAVAGAGDVNNDGLDDVIVGAPGGAGRAIVVFGKADNAMVEEADIVAGTGGGFAITGAAGLDQLGWSVGTAGDFNGDGRSDVILGAPGADPAKSNAAGQAYVVFGRDETTPVMVADLAAGTDGIRFDGEADFDFAGWSVGRVGDVDRDGYDDVVVGAQGSDVAAGTAGRVYVIYGEATPTSLAATALNDGTRGFVYDGAGLLHAAGSSVHGSGDTNGDGFADVTMGSPRASSSSGRAYVGYGGNYSAANTLAFTAGDDEIIGTPRGETLIGGDGADTLTSAGGADVIAGGSGDDVIRIEGNAFFRIDGGLGFDTVSLAGEGFSLDTSNFFDNAIVDIEAIDLTGEGDNALFIDTRGLRMLSSSSNTLLVTGDAGDQLVADLEGAGFVDQGSDGGFTSYSNGVLTLAVADTVETFASLDP